MQPSKTPVNGLGRVFQRFQPLTKTKTKTKSSINKPSHLAAGTASQARLTSSLQAEFALYHGHHIENGGFAECISSFHPLIVR